MKFIKTFIILIFITGCSVDLNNLIINYLGEKGEAVLQKKVMNRATKELFLENESLNRLLSEFKSSNICAGVYDYSGIKIYLGIAKFSNADQAYGVYSGLTCIPRERWEYMEGEISYKKPFISGWNGIYAFWFYSPTNPDNYFSFYKTYGEELLTEFRRDFNTKQHSRSYHWKLLPIENRHKNSLFYFKARTLHGLDLINTYSAKYHAGRNVAQIYIEKMDSEDNADNKFKSYISFLKRNAKDLQPFSVMIAGPGNGVYWKDHNSFQIIYKYRWLIFMVNEVPNLKFARNFIRNIYKNMMKIRDEVLSKHGSYNNIKVTNSQL